MGKALAKIANENEMIVNATSLDEISKRSLKIRQGRTPQELVLTREGKKGEFYNYVNRLTVMKWLDENYPGWSFETIPDSFKEYGGYLCVTAKLTVWEPTGLPRIITCTGQAEIRLSKTDRKPLQLTYYKNAETDALKRCVFTLGGFSDVYTDDEAFSALQTDKDVSPTILAKLAKLLFLQIEDYEVIGKMLRAYADGTMTIEELLKTLSQYNIIINLEELK